MSQFDKKFEASNWKKHMQNFSHINGPEIYYYFAMQILLLFLIISISRYWYNKSTLQTKYT